MKETEIKKMIQALVLSTTDTKPAETSQLVRNFLGLLTKKRIKVRSQQLRAWLAEAVREAEGVARVEVRSREPLSSQAARVIRQYYSEKLSKDVELVEVLDQSLLGGFRIQYRDQVLDATVDQRVKDLEKAIGN